MKYMLWLGLFLISFECAGKLFKIKHKIFAAVPMTIAKKCGVETAFRCFIQVNF